MRADKYEIIYADKDQGDRIQAAIDDLVSSFNSAFIEQVERRKSFEKEMKQWSHSEQKKADKYYSDRMKKDKELLDFNKEHHKVVEKFLAVMVKALSRK